MTVDDIITAIVQREGDAYTDRYTDRGGPTRYGITLATLAAWRKTPTTAADVAALTEAEARDIYAARYVTGPFFDRIADVSLRALVVDSGVLHGQDTATMWLQAAAGVRADGILGPVSVAAIGARAARGLYLGVVAARLRSEGELIARDHSQADNAGGWANRTADLLEGCP